MRVLGFVLALATAGCLNEQSVYIHPDQSRRVQPAGAERDSVEMRSTRAWLADAHPQLDDLLPPADAPSLLTENLTGPNGVPVDVFAHFQLNPRALQSAFSNYSGLRFTALGASQALTIDTPPPVWAGFEDVWITMPDGPRLAARLGLAGGARTPKYADCIVILPGFFGDNGVKRIRALAEFLRDAGFHVLALEMRGHGQTEHSQPGVAYTFGVRETDDLMHVADWLQAMPHVRRTGLIGFCWSANVALLAAWYEHRPVDDANITPTIARELPAKPDRVRFAAGIMAFSPIVEWERLVDTLQTEYSSLDQPVSSGLQKTIRERMERKRYRNPSGSLRDLIEYEYQRCGVTLPGGTLEGYRFLRLMPYPGRPLAPKLKYARVPVLIVHAANDPLASAQDVVNLLADEHNPRVAGIILPNGGHVGFANYAPEYTYSLVASFFDEAAGAAGPPPADLATGGASPGN